MYMSKIKKCFFNLRKSIIKQNLEKCKPPKKVFWNGEPGCVSRQKNLTRRRGDAEDVGEVLKNGRFSILLEPRCGSIFLAVGFNPRNKEHAKKNIVK